MCSLVECEPAPRSRAGHLHSMVPERLGGVSRFGIRPSSGLLSGLRRWVRIREPKPKDKL